MPKPKSVTLENIRQGAINDLFMNDLEAVLENIMDINTDWKKKRQITIKATLFARDENRDVVHCEISCEPKLAAGKPILTSMSIGHERLGEKLRPIAYEMDGVNPRQLSLITADDFSGKEDGE